MTLKLWWLNYVQYRTPEFNAPWTVSQYNGRQDPGEYSIRKHLAANYLYVAIAGSLSNFPLEIKSRSCQPFQHVGKWLLVWDIFVVLATYVQKLYHSPRGYFMRRRGKQGLGPHYHIRGFHFITVLEHLSHYDRLIWLTNRADESISWLAIIFANYDGTQRSYNFLFFILMLLPITIPPYLRVVYLLLAFVYRQNDILGLTLLTTNYKWYTNI